jgi:ligand-binding sensor domain-containing protein
MKLTTRITALAFLFMSNMYGQVNNMQFVHHNIKDGVISERINDACQDKSGFIWIGTENGVSKYDGLEFINYTYKSGDTTRISHRKIWAVCSDAKNNVWVGNWTGLNKYDRERDEFITYMHSGLDDFTPNGGASYLFGDSKGLLWIGTKDNLYYASEPEPFNEKSFNILKTKNSEGRSISFPNVNNIIELENNSFIVISNGIAHIVNFENKKSVKIKTPDNIIKNITAIAAIDNKRYVIGNNSGIFITKLINDSFSIENEFNTNSTISLISNNVTSLVVKNNREIWVGTNNGITLLRESENGFQNQHIINDYLDKNSLAGNNISKLFVDEAGIVWISTRGYGLDKYDENQIKFGKFILSEKDIEGKPTILSIRYVLKDSYGGLIIHTNAGLYYLNESNYKYKKIEHPEINRNISGFIERQPGEVWLFGNDLKRVFYNVDENANIQISSVDTYNDSVLLQNNKITELWDATFENKNTLWLVSRKSGLLKLNIYDDTDLLPEVAEQHLGSKETIRLVPKNITCLIADQDKRLWISTQGKGIYVFNIKTNEFERNYTSNQNNKYSIGSIGILSLHADNNNNIWAGSIDGEIFKIDPQKNTVITYSEKYGLPNQKIMAIVRDKSNNLWVSSGGGLFKYDPQEDFFDGHTTDDGIQGFSYIENSVFYDTINEQIYFGGVKGLNSISPKQIELNTFYKPTVVLTNLMVNNLHVAPGDKTGILDKTLGTTKAIKIKHKYNDFRIHFSALSYSQPEKNLYKYKLEDYNENWIETSAETPWAYYSNLPRGKYKLLIEASNSSHVWSGIITELKIHVRPPWWKTYFFYFIIVVTITFSIFTFTKMRVAQMKKDKKKLEDDLKEGKNEIKQKREQLEKQQEELKQYNVQERLNKWHNKGIIKFSDIISENRHDLDVLAQNIITAINEYVESQTGIIYFSEKETDSKEVLIQRGTYAVEGDKVRKTKILPGEGMVGCCFKEKKVLHLDDLPECYSKLSSGLGEINLKHLILIPIIHENKVEGVIELASFEKLEDYKIHFIETL